MPQYIEVNGETVEFPDGMSDAQIAAVLKGQKTPTEAPKPSMGSEILRQLGLTARAGGQYAADLAGMFTNPVTALGNQLAGRQIMTPIPQLAEQGMTAIGLPEPKNTLERAVQSGAGAMAGTGIQAAAAKGIPLLQGLTQNLPKQLAAASAGGTASQAAGEKISEDFKDPYAGLAAGILAGTVAGGLAGRTVDLGGKAVNAAKGFLTKETTSTPTLTMDEIKARAQKAYRSMEDQNVYVKKDSLTNQLFADIEDRLGKENFNPNLDTHKPVAQVLLQVKDMAKDPFVSFSKVEQMRSALSDLKNSNDPATRRLAGAAISEFDNFLAFINKKDILAIGGDVGKALSDVKAARADWRNLSRAQTIEDALKYAEVSADKPTASQSELIRNGMINLARDKNKMKVFSETEQNAIRAVAKGGSLDTFLTVMGKFNPERSQLAAYGGLATAITNPSTAAPLVGLGAAGFAADKLQGVMRSRAGEQLINKVASGTLQPIPQNMAWRGMLSGLTPLPGETP